MFWIFCFWLTAALLLLPLPFKLNALITAKDTRSAFVKYEEWANTLLLAIGLMAFCSFTYPRSLPLSKHGWQGWLLLTIGVSIMALGRSAKLRHATEVFIGSQRCKDRHYY